MGSKGGTGQYGVIDYYMSIHMAICNGPIDALLGIYVKERDAWPGKTKYDDDDDQGEVDDDAPIVSFKDFIANLGVTNVPTATDSVVIAETILNINKPDLFGGDKKEGGVKGKAHYLPGGPSQLMPANLAAKLKMIPSKMPGYRGISSIFFYGDSAKRAFLWCQNNPYMPAAWFTVFRRPKGLAQNKATIQRGNYPPDANPAHMIYECMTNTEWGMGSPSTLFNVDSFNGVADVLIDEQFGLSMMWSEQSTIEDFVKEIIDHIQATVFIDPTTGLWTLKLIRDDYDHTSIFTIDPSNCDLTNRQRKAWAETINEVVVTWTNPTNEKEETVTFQDLANMAMQGGTVSDSRNYYGVRNVELATELGARDIRSAAYPFFSADAEVDRTAWRLKPGDVVNVVWPEDGIENLVCRVGKVDYGKPGEMTVKVNIIEDIFSLEAASYSAPPPTGWEDTDKDPDPMQYRKYITLPYPAVVALGQDSLVTEDQYPRVVPGIFGQQDDVATINFELFGPITDSVGTSIKDIATLLQTNRSVLAVAIPAAVTTTISRTNLGTIMGDEDDPAPGDFIYIGGGADGVTEIAMVAAYDSVTDIYTLRRGVFDTIPRAWSVGTQMWHVGQTWTEFDATERLAGAPILYRQTPRTRLGILPYAEAPQDTFTPTARPHLPFRPANVKIDGTDIFTPKVYLPGSIPTTIVMTWANRNRLMEDTVVKAWNDATVTPEDGQLTLIRVYDETDAVLHTYTDLAGTSANLTVADFSGHSLYKVGVFSKRDGLESLQGAMIGFEFRAYGYGNNYGNDYGQNDG